MAPRIIVIDDENIVCQMSKRVLEQEGYQVETYVDSTEALERIKTTPFDVVITDFKMENVSGMDILREVTQRYPHTRVIMLTAYATLDTAIDALREKIYDFFPKPVKIDELKKAVKRALDTR